MNELEIFEIKHSQALQHISDLEEKYQALLAQYLKLKKEVERCETR